MTPTKDANRINGGAPHTLSMWWRPQSTFACTPPQQEPTPQWTGTPSTDPTLTKKPCCYIILLTCGS